MGYFVSDVVTSHPYIRVTDMRPGRVDMREVKYVPEAAFPPIRNYRIYKDDLFISVAGTLGIVGKIPDALDGANLTENANRISAIECDRDFLLHVMLSPVVQNFIESERTVGAQPKLALARIRKFSIPLPPSDIEQSAIATALGDMDALLAAQDALIAKKRAVKQGAMQELLTGKRRLPGYSGEWEVERLGQLGQTYGGLVGKSKKDFGQGDAQYVPFVNVMANIVIDVHAFDKVKVSPSESQNRVLNRDLLFNGSSETPEEVAMCSLVADDVDNLYLNSFCFGFRPKDNVRFNSMFLAYYMRSQVGRDLIKSLAQGSTRYNLSKTAFLDGELRLPSTDEQAAITAVLSDMDTELSTLEAQRAKTVQLKQGMMQTLLTGRIRLG